MLQQNTSLTNNQQCSSSSSSSSSPDSSHSSPLCLFVSPPRFHFSSSCFFKLFQILQVSWDSVCNNTLMWLCLWVSVGGLWSCLSWLSSLIAFRFAAAFSPSSQKGVLHTSASLLECSDVNRPSRSQAADKMQLFEHLHSFLTQQLLLEMWSKDVLAQL